MEKLVQRHCESIAKGALPLSELSGWTLEEAAIAREFSFKNYHQTMAFVNAVARIAHREDHYPDVEVHYNRCLVRHTTHAVGGLSMNDFVCAAKVDALQEN